MATLTVSSNLGSLAAKLRLAAGAIDAGVGTAMPNIAAAIAQNLQDATPIGADTESGGTPPPGDESGKLYDSYRVFVTSGRASGSFLIRTVQPLKMQWVRYGTGIYGPRGSRIYPKRAAMLRWEDAAGQVHFAKSIAGMKPNDFPAPVIADGRELLITTLREVVQEALAIITTA